MFLYLNYPSWIKPEVFPNVEFLGMIRWYGLMYVFAFTTAYLLLRKQAKEGALNTATYKITEDDLFSFLATGIIFLLIGARVGSTLIYDTTGKYWRAPWLIFWPFENGHFTGFAGMSYHGGFIGGLLGMILWCRIKKQPLWKWIDAMTVAIPLGYTFGRLGNFLNGELFGRITTQPWGMIFPHAKKFSASLPWVQDFAAQIGMNISNETMVNLPRHPSQLYEAFFEGIVLFLILWFTRKHKKFDGQMGCMYAAGYGIFRFFIEYLREPDADLGFRIGKDTSANIYETGSLLNFSTGQILCFLMIVFAIVMTIILIIRQKKHPELKPLPYEDNSKNTKAKSKSKK